MITTSLPSLIGGIKLRNCGLPLVARINFILKPRTTYDGVSKATNLVFMVVVVSLGPLITQLLSVFLCLLSFGVNILAKLWTLEFFLNICLQLSVSKLIVESNSLIVAYWFNTKSQPYQQYFDILDDILDDIFQLEHHFPFPIDGNQRI